MTRVKAKICGLNDPQAVDAAVTGGASHIGLVFYPPSPRNVSIEQAADLVGPVPKEITIVGLFVDPDDAFLEQVLKAVPLDLLQLHGSETPARVGDIRARFSLPVMKALKIADKEDLASANQYKDVADMLLFDAKAPKDMKNALPGGNGLVFDWRMLTNTPLSLPWMLAGGLNKENVAQAVTISGADFVDTSSGVEEKPGKKDPAAIHEFLKVVYEIRN
ncbi:phosphoribosylanthranilate isomerase [Sneathiella sp.]|uniref:phosphoribosylanthranilate isomerase n=1 Tax=Sneathiella sp. TaxID=1964365 RepID=UPI0039E35C6E